MKIENSPSKIVDYFYLRSSEIQVNLNFIREALKQLYEKVANVIILPLLSLRKIQLSSSSVQFSGRREDSKVRKSFVKRNIRIHPRNFRKISSFTTLRDRRILNIKLYSYRRKDFSDPSRDKTQRKYFFRSIHNAFSSCYDISWQLCLGFEGEIYS